MKVPDQRISGCIALVSRHAFRNIPPVEGDERTDTALRVQLRLAI